MMPPLGRALISVYDKTGVAEFAKVLQKFGVELISTGGTARHLSEHGVATVAISEITGFAEILSGRVKTLHPKIFGGLLALRQDEEQMAEVERHGIGLIDLVVVNLYPFEATIARPDVSHADALENIDIGGPSMIRAAAKNYIDVAVITSPDQYREVIEDIEKSHGIVSEELRKRLAAQAFEMTSRYDKIISTYLAEKSASQHNFPFQIDWRLEKVQDLRYGENPHQQAALYRDAWQKPYGLISAKQLHGKELSFNNMIDLDAASGIVQGFEEPCVVIIKHTNPCGVATGEVLRDTYQHARATDPVSSFGGIVGLNRTVDGDTAQAIAEIFTEAVIAPAYAPEALEILKSKKNLRLIELPRADGAPKTWDIKCIEGGLLLQDKDRLKLNEISFEVVTDRQPTDEEWAAMKFGWRVVKWVKSNAIVYASQDRTLGIGAGQMSRVDSSLFAADKAARMGLSLKGSTVASDAFFPFRDGIDAAAKAGATAVIQPGGSIRDQEVIAAANEQNLTMVFTHVRHFRH